MNQREPTSAPVGAGQALPCLALLLLSLLVVARAWSRPIFFQASATAQHKPYLVALGSPPLRFQEPAPPPDLTARLAAGAPPQPAAGPASNDPAPSTDPVAPVAPSNSSISPSAPPTASSLAIDSASLVEIETTTDGAPTPARTPLPILPDELRPQARPEDFLPFFQIPVSRPGDLNVIVPVPRAPADPAALPPSSATYTQTP